jgi:hypothetical protein
LALVENEVLLISQEKRRELGAKMISSFTVKSERMTPSIKEISFGEMHFDATMQVAPKKQKIDERRRRKSCS